MRPALFNFVTSPFRRFRYRGRIVFSRTHWLHSNTTAAGGQAKRPMLASREAIESQRKSSAFDGGRWGVGVGVKGRCVWER